MIEIKDLSKSYGKNRIYSNFCLSLEEGRITCLLGPSGSGKTTLLNVLAGLTPFSGQVPPLSCSYIFQTPTLVPNMTVRANLGLVCKDGQKVGEMIGRVGLGGREESYPVSLSGGEAQRVAIARAFLRKSDILLMDEPFSSLDIKLKYKMLDLFFDVWRNDGRTVLWVTHDVDEAVCAGERILVLSRGEIAADFVPESAAPRDVSSADGVRAKVVGFLMK